MNNFSCVLHILRKIETKGNKQVSSKTDFSVNIVLFFFPRSKLSTTLISILDTNFQVETRIWLSDFFH